MSGFQKRRWDYDAWLDMLSVTLKERPISSKNIAGVNAVLLLVSKWLTDRGFETTLIENQTHASGLGANILVAKREPRGLHLTKKNWVGLFGHVDIEDCPAEQASLWTSFDPFTPEVIQDRLVSRGIADNLGPLLMRILSFRSDDTQSTGVLWLIHGEEEIGSPFAHLTYPILKNSLLEMSWIALWIEETGYFLKSGDQRILIKDSHNNMPLIHQILDILRSPYPMFQFHGNLITEERVMNKAFGTDRCPCLTHLLDGSVPYISFGPNDSFSRIHEPNESLPLAILELSFAQFGAVIFGLSL